MSIAGTWGVSLRMFKPDGNFIVKTLEPADGGVNIEFDEQMTAAPGVGYLDLKLSPTEGDVITCHAVVVVDTPVYNDQVIESVSMVDGLIFPDDFQEKLIAGANITISENNVISATGGGEPGTHNYNALDNKPSINGVTLQGNKTSAQLNIPTYTAGSNVSISAGNVISATDTTYTAGTGLDLTGSAFGLNTSTQNTLAAVAGKQDALTAGSNINISGNTISAIDTTYTAGDNVSISAGNVISATDTTYTAGSGISISAGNVISATGGGGGSYVAGTGIDITGDTISLDSGTQSTLSSVAGKQDALTAGSNISISAGNVISATDTTYTAGDGLALSGGVFSLSTATKNSLVATENIGEPLTYDPDHEYLLGEACEHEGLWYRSLYGYTGTGPGPWDPTKWERTDSWTELTALNSNLSGNLVYTKTYPSTTTWTNLIQDLYNNLTATTKYQSLTDNQRCCLKFVFGNDVYTVSNYQSTLFLLGSVQNNGSGTTVTRSMYVSASTRNYSRFTVTSSGTVAGSDYTTQAIGSELVVKVLM